MDLGGIALGTMDPAHSRAPLLSKPNPSPPSTTPSKQVRRMTSFVRRYQVDSSEELPSPHASIYEAISFSDDSGSRVESWPMAPVRGISHKDRIDENGKAIHGSMQDCTVDDGQFRYGNGTILETITEQKSNGTIRSLFRPRSAEDLHNATVPRHLNGFVQARGPRRKHSFSLDDLELIHRSYHDACAMIEKAAHKPLLVHEIYAQGRVPVRGPLERPPTPPGMPSWTASQNQPARPASGVAYRIPGTPNRLQRFLGIEPSGVGFSSRVPHPNLRYRAVSAPVRGQAAPRFRPPRSAYGSMAQHPFNNAPVARVAIPLVSETTTIQISSNAQSRSSKRRKPGQNVRFTPSPTARDSEIHNLRNAIESSSASALHPMAPLQPAESLLQVPQVDTASAKQKPCPHRRTRLVVSDASKPKNNTQPSSSCTISTPLPQNRSLDSSSQVLPSIVISGSVPSATTRRNPGESPLSSPISTTSSRHGSRNSESLIFISSETPCTTSASSMGHLMSGALSTQSSVARESLPASPTATTFVLSETAHRPLHPKSTMSCWRCFLDRWIEKTRYWIDASTSCLCFVCCGYDCDDDLLPHGTENGCGSLGEYGVNCRAAADFYVSLDMRSSRREVTERTPAVMF